jgi:hypothetical protein
MKTPRYWVRFNDHVHGGSNDMDILVMVLSRFARKLTEKSSGREYEIQLRRPDRADRFETAMNRWETRGTIKWGRFEDSDV